MEIIAGVGYVITNSNMYIQNNMSNCIKILYNAYPYTSKAIKVLQSFLTNRIK